MTLSSRKLHHFKQQQVLSIDVRQYLVCVSLNKSVWHWHFKRWLKYEKVSNKVKVSANIMMQTSGDLTEQQRPRKNKEYINVLYLHIFAFKGHCCSLCLEGASFLLWNLSQWAESSSVRGVAPDTRSLKLKCVNKRGGASHTLPPSS